MIGDALRATKGNFTRAGALCGMKRQSISGRIDAAPALQLVVEQIIQEELDEFEEKLKTMGLKLDNFSAIMAYLNAKGRARGYGFRVGVDVKGSIDHNIRKPAEVEGMTLEGKLVEYRELAAIGNDGAKH